MLCHLAMGCHFIPLPQLAMTQFINKVLIVFSLSLSFDTDSSVQWIPSKQFYQTADRKGSATLENGYIWKTRP